MIFISTACIGKRNMKEVLQQYSEIDVDNVELGAVHTYEENMVEYSLEHKKKNETNYTVHGYFPPKEKELIINLASQDPKILEKSKKHVKKMIEVAKLLEANVCSFHSGFRVDPERVGVPFPRENISSYEASYSTFLQSLVDICRYAEETGVEIAIEPNELSPHNLVDDKNKLLLMCELREFQKLFSDLGRESVNNLGVLLDLGHLKVTSHTLKFDPEEFIRGVRDKVKQVHIHENDGTGDQHLPLREDSWSVKMLKKYELSGIPIVLEASPLSEEKLLEQKELLERVEAGIR